MLDFFSSSTDSGAVSWVIAAIFPTQFSGWYRCSAAHANQTASAQPSGAGGSDGSADDEGPPSEVSLASYIPSFRVMPASHAVISCCSTCRSQDQPEDCRLNSNITVSSGSNSKASCMIKFLVKELEEHYLTAKADMMLAARTKPIHGETWDLQHWHLP